MRAAGCLHRSRSRAAGTCRQRRGRFSTPPQMPTLVPDRSRERHYPMTQTPEPRLRRPGRADRCRQGRTRWPCTIACHYDPATGCRGGRLRFCRRPQLPGRQPHFPPPVIPSRQRQSRPRPQGNANRLIWTDSDAPTTPAQAYRSGRSVLQHHPNLPNSGRCRLAYSCAHLHIADGRGGTRETQAHMPWRQPTSSHAPQSLAQRGEMPVGCQ
jgi:hypothetical protein